MADIQDYPSLVQAILDYSHRSNLATYVDHFIAQAQEQIERDIPAINVGDYLRFQENAYPPVAIDGNGHAPVPVDFIAPKILTVTGNNITRTLTWKRPQWIYSAYPFRGPDAMPKFIARDVVSNDTSWPTAGGSLSFTAGSGQTVFSLAAGPAGVAVVLVSLDGRVLAPVTDYSISTALNQLTLTEGALAGQILLVTYGAAGLAPPAASNTSVFIFGPSPNSAYTISGTYFAALPALTSDAPTNWLVLNAPGVLFAACMLQVGYFIPDDTLTARWAPLYQARLKSLVTADRQERYGSGPISADVP